MQTITLNDGVKMPMLGFGVYQIQDQEECQRCVEDALSIGYRSIDTAQAYLNEEAVGAAIMASGIKRDELFITTKLWITDMSEDRTSRAFEASAKKLGLDYLDLYLIHQPFGDTYGAWRTMSRLKHEGRIRSIGVSNFYPDRIVDFCLNNEIIPSINQIECNPFFQQEEAKQILEQNGIVLESWAPFGEGRNDMFGNATLTKIGKKYGKTAAQVILRWLIERGIVVIPKTVRKEKMKENLAIFDFALDSDDMCDIAKLDEGKSLFLNHYDPEAVRFLNNHLR